VTDGPRRRRSAPAKTLPAGALEWANHKAEEAIMAQPGSPEAIECSQAALAHLFLALEPSLAGAFGKSREREEWVGVLRFRAAAGLFERQLGSMAMALEELDRGAVDRRLMPAKSRQGAPSTTEEARWRLLAVQLFDLLAERSGCSKGAAALELSAVAVERGQTFSGRTVRDWKKSLAAEASHLPRWPARLFQPPPGTSPPADWEIDMPEAARQAMWLRWGWLQAATLEAYSRARR
jgi:hypothetical protein